MSIACESRPLLGPPAVEYPYSMTTGTHRCSIRQAWRPHSHPEHELLWGPTGGSLQVTAGGVDWIVPPDTGVWVPAGTVHAAVAGPGTSFYCTFFRPEARACPWTQPGLFEVSPLLREVLLHMHRENMPHAARARAEQVAFDMLAPLDETTDVVPMPADPRARVVAEALLANPGDRRSLAEWSESAGASVRTLTRVFSQGTGMTFAQWRTDVRIRAAIRYLKAGVPVSVVGRRVGYDTSSAFVAVFRRATGRTPGTVLAEHRVRSST
ncbi:AraC family transcriptional regulator [Rhodococcus sp. ABRD24]|uniref:helix-turn-helix domain-containing protein n=1 Tax=Rhodococcus sp. ABRD24 TaxID=2507582 RepID=UPI00103891B4|nr:helix-turn-helix transcriptional regulator [Rhodococcus sp. ABRD24]QBJ95744.1 AraC family transcriptional regulator [Rhodococcus sp. ABRD24]